jgi:NAD(P)-dependent dehydrogenase (short-subunit alcohol dehydrogenase family)
MSEIRFDGRVAVVTGAGGGLGRSYALELARRGAQVVVNDLGGAADGRGSGTSMADAVVKEICEAGGSAAASYDSVATPEGGEAIIQTAVDHFGRVDILINNAGILRDKSFAKLSTEDLEAILDVHLKGSFFVSQPAFRIMKQNSYGRMLFTSSASGLFGNFGQTNYAAAKMGIVGLSSVLAIEGAKAGITSNVLAPAAITRLTAGLMGADLSEAESGPSSPDRVTPLAVYLVSEECQLTHQIFGAGQGRFTRIFIGQTPGWTKPAQATAEELRDHIDEIRDPEGYAIMEGIAQEMALMQKALKG